MKIGSQITNPGEMRTSIRLQSRSETASAGGFQVDTWADIAVVWAKWENAHGGEAWQALAVQADAPATVTIRYRSGIDTTCAVLKGSNRFEIVSIDNIQERNEYLELKVRRWRSG